MRSPKTTARIAGILSLLLALLGPFSMMYVAGRLIVSARQTTLAH